MKILTNENNTATLKLLIAANLAGKSVELQNVSFEGVFAGPRSLPLLQVDDQLAFFSSNAAAQYLFPVLDMSQNGQSQQMQEWEATRLQPAVSGVLAAKTPPADLRQALQALLQHVEALVARNKYLFGDMLSAADISLWSTLYPLYHTEALKTFLTPHPHILRWYTDIAQAKAVQEAVKQWGGSVDKPFAPISALGAPQLASLSSPVGTPMDVPTVVPGPTAEEISSAKDSWENGRSRLQAPVTQERFAMPVKDRKNVLITSSLPYVNNVPHLGNIIGCVLSGDIFARYCRLCDYNTLYICGTDEYGTATETKALQEGVTPQQICDKYYDIHNAVYRWFDIGFDHFGRTSTPEHTRIVQKMFLQVKDNGFISSQTVDQLHCEKCVKFLADRFVEGTCPHPGCLYEDARGDQCDKCGKLVNAIELIKPRCKICGDTPAVRPSEQLFIELGQLEPSLRTWCTKVESGWSPSARAVARSWLREPLRARAVTRDLKWGVPVPVEGFTNKVFYVWFDAPLGYWSITQCLTKDYEKWWKPDKDVQVKLYQFMAKDNVPFHAIMFPTACIAANQGHVLVDHIFATEYLNYEEGKFSKSRGVGVFGTDAQDTGIPSDVWRFYLASVRPESSDSSFSWIELGTRNNSELLNNLGNFCHRSLSFCANSFKGKVPELRATQADYELMALVNREVVAYVQHMEKGRLREALKHVLLVSKLGNQHMQSSQPWVLLKGTDDDKERGSTAIAMCCQLVALLCVLLAPYMPATGRKLRAQLNIAADALRLNPTSPSFIRYLPAGHEIGKPEPLFTKIEPEVLEKLKAKYAGTQDDREKKQNGDVTGKCVTSSVAHLERAVAEQGEKVRKLKASTKDKAVWAPEVNKLLELKKQLTAAQAQAPPTSGSASVADLEKAVAEQGDKVRQLKASTKDKSVWAPEVNKLLELKKQLTAAQAQATPTCGASAADLEKAIAEQDMLSAADISLWSTLYPLYHTEALKTFLTPHPHILRWYTDIAQAKAVQEAVKQWGGSVDKPFAPISALGAPQLASLSSPVGTPMDVPTVVPGPTAEEISSAKDSWENGRSRLQAPVTQERFAMPVKDRKNVLITSSLPYVNNVPHLGNIIGCVLSGDIFARYCRLCDYNTLYICGTDEYGTATETKALQEGVTPQQICDKYYDIHNAVYRWFDIGFDHFGRTSTPEHTRIVQKMFLQVKDNGFISSQTVDQLHCEKCVKFLADRFVEGTCPHPGCLYEDARGDQCDKCGKLVNAIELIKPRCKICGDTPAVRPSEQLFIELGQLEPSLRTWCTKVESGWSPSARAVARSWLREPLRARAVTRDLKWGVPVPVEGFTNKVFYVWFDAPLGYWSITQCLTKDYEKWWKPDKDVQVKLYQFMAKDNVPFHAIMFPTACIAANQGHVLVDHIYATEYLNYEEGKFSKSRGVGVFGTDAQDTGIPSDVWRFYLASVRPESSDSSFSWIELGTRNNSELLNNLGNFCHRSLSFCANSFKGRVPELRATQADYELMALVNREVVAYVQHMEKGRLREALKHVLLVSKLGNQHMQSSQPWVLLKGTDDDKERGSTAIAMCCQLVALLCVLLAPYMPATGRKLRAQLNIAADALRLNPTSPSFIRYLPAGHEIGKPEPLFTKIEPEVLEKLKAKYAGTQDDREKKQNGDVTGKCVTSSVAHLEKAVAEQGEKVRKLKASTKDKAVWAPEVNKLLELKKQLTAAQAQAPPTSGSASVADLEKAVAEQGDKVRQLKASTKDKSVWAPEVNKLLELKKQLTAAQAQATPTSGASAADIEKAIAEQGDKVRKLKASTKDKALWTPEVNILLDLKKRLAALQTK